MDHVREDCAHVSPIPPPRTRRKMFDVLRAHVGTEEKGYALHQEVIQVWTHWHPFAGGKVRHHERNCHWCEFFGEKDVRWYGYMPAWSDRLGKVVALEITHQAALDCAKLCKKRVPLRGRLIELFRYGKNNHLRAGVRIADEPSRRELPPPIDECDFLDAIFHKCEVVPATRLPARYREEVES